MQPSRKGPRGGAGELAFSAAAKITGDLAGLGRLLGGSPPNVQLSSASTRLEAVQGCSLAVGTPQLSAGTKYALGAVGFPLH